MKQVITFLIASVVTLTSFATVKPAKPNNAEIVKTILKKANTLSVSLKAAGKVNLTWVAALETSTTNYQIQKSINGGQFKTIAILMGETKDTYTYRDNIKDITGKVEYKVLLIDNNAMVKTITQSIIVL
jgi:hypothetical protein